MKQILNIGLERQAENREPQSNFEQLDELDQHLILKNQSQLRRTILSGMESLSLEPRAKPKQVLKTTPAQIVIKHQKSSISWSFLASLVAVGALVFFVGVGAINSYKNNSDGIFKQAKRTERVQRSSKQAATAEIRVKSKSKIKAKKTNYKAKKKRSKRSAPRP